MLPKASESPLEIYLGKAANNLRVSRPNHIDIADRLFIKIVETLRNEEQSTAVNLFFFA